MALVLALLDLGSPNDLKGRIPEVTLECMRYLRQRFPTVMISVEVEKPARIGLQDLAVVADVVFFSKSWAQVDRPQSTLLHADADRIFLLGKWL